MTEAQMAAMTWLKKRCAEEGKVTLCSYTQAGKAVLMYADLVANGTGDTIWTGGLS